MRSNPTIQRPSRALRLRSPSSPSLRHWCRRDAPAALIRSSRFAANSEMISMPRLSLLLTAVLASPIAAQVGNSTVCASPTAAATKQPATIPIDVHNNHVFVKVCVGEHPLDLVLDTGASETYLDLHAAQR